VVVVVVVVVVEMGVTPRDPLLVAEEFK